MNCISDFFTYETTKSVVVKSWTIGIINRAVQLLIISYFVGCLSFSPLGAHSLFRGATSQKLASAAAIGDLIPRCVLFPSPGRNAQSPLGVGLPKRPPPSCILWAPEVEEEDPWGLSPQKQRGSAWPEDPTSDRDPGTIRELLPSASANIRGPQRWVFLHEKAYQVRDTAIESSVVTKVKGFGHYANRVMDVSDYVTPPQVGSPYLPRGARPPMGEPRPLQEPVRVLHAPVFPQSEEKFRCVSDSQCGPERFPGVGILTGRCVNYSSELRTCEIQGWCPTEVDTVEMPVMMEAENFTIFIKNSIRFPLFNFEKGNLLPSLTAADLKTCRFHPDKAPFCPILRVGDVVKFAGQDFAKLASTGGVLGIKIGWVCDLDKAWDQCIPKYSFTRLDSVSEKSSVSPGYNFRFAKYYKTENGSEYRTLLKAFGIRFDVLVYGNAGKFDIIPTIISSVAAFTSVGVVSAAPLGSVRRPLRVRPQLAGFGQAVTLSFPDREPNLLPSPPCWASPCVNISSPGELTPSTAAPDLLQSPRYKVPGTVLCDIILLNFLKGADQYKAKKFEEVNETTLKVTASANPVYPSDQTTEEKQSTDSGAYSIGH
ncbi:hypothetical protein J1605_002618 [Eschrichtius robustus]|uniref:P2X purinoceptor n=1 Tax=Eschrichtius robustus TaxID=9764 RepID=A0AB34HW14_ESCRO|nr:hypothetical protein J1605_002618 [Eschrichtius robustus]